NATSCKAWSTCAPGTHVSLPGSAAADRQCAACAPGTFSNGPNQTTCQPAGACAAGTVQTTPATPTSPPVCAPCAAGTYCAGGTAPAVACAAETWDHDGDAATACVPWTGCAPGQFVGAPGSATA